MVESASICDSGTSTTTPQVSKSRRTTAVSASVAFPPGASPVTALPTTAGVFGIERKTATSAPRIDAKVARVTPAARLTTIVPGRRAGAISRSRSGTIAGFTPIRTTRADAAASAFACGRSSSAMLVTPSSSASTSAFARVRFVTVTPEVASPDRTRPWRIAPPIDPAPMIAMEGSTAGSVDMPISLRSAASASCSASVDLSP